MLFRSSSVPGWKRVPDRGSAAAPKPDHPRHRLDSVLNHPVRFSIAATLAAVDEAEFAFVRDTVQVSDSVLSKQIVLLEQPGYIAVKRDTSASDHAPGCG